MQVRPCGTDHANMVASIWALRRSDTLTERRITHVLSLVGFNPSSLKNFKDEPWSHYGREFEHLVIDIDDVDDANLLIELPRAVRFVDSALQPARSRKPGGHAKDSLEGAVEAMGLAPAGKQGGVFVHCAAGKSRSVSVVIAYLLWRYPDRFDPDLASAQGTSRPGSRPRRETSGDAVRAALSHIRRTRPMADPNDGFMSQLELWWEMGCPVQGDIEKQTLYQRWAYHREVEEHLAVGQAPSRLRFEDEEGGGDSEKASGGLSLRCKKCRRTLATSPFIVDHKPDDATAGAQCQHFFIEPLGWMRGELEKGSLNGRLLCPNQRCGAAVGRYDWKGFKCSCAAWVTPAFSLQRARVDDVVARQAPATPGGEAARQQTLGIRMPPGSRSGNL